KLQANTLFIGEEYFERHYNDSCQMERTSLVRILQENMSFAIAPGFSDAKGKIAVTLRAREKAIMKKSASELVNCNENSTGVISAGIGHGVPLSKPDLFNQIIEKWINGEEVPEECKAIE